MARAGFISCPACGSSYPWKPQHAGKKVRCRCGRTFEATPPKAEPVAEPEEPGIFALEADDVTAKPARKPTVTRMPAAPTGGRAESAAATAPAASLAAAYPTHGRRRVVAQEEDAGAGKRKFVLPIAVLVMLVGCGIFFFMAVKGGLIGAKQKPMLGDDKLITEMIRDENGTELKEWATSHSRHMILNMTPGQVTGFADRLYALGAVKVYAFGEVISRSVAVELPDDPAKRKALFEFEKEHNGWRSKTKDVGQRYFLLWM